MERGDTNVIMGLVETHEKYRRVDWGEGVDFLSVMREQADKKGGGISLIKEKGGCTWEKIERGEQNRK